MSDEWIGIVKAAAPRYLKGAIDLTVRRRLVLRMLEARGLITLNYLGSHETTFDVDWKEPPIESYADGGQVEYARRDYLKQATMDWRGYVGTDLMTIKEQEMLKGGDYVLVNRYKRILPKLTKAVRNQIGLEFYIDGNASGNENRFCGVETFCGADTSYDSTGADVADLVAKPDDSYFGLDTDLGQGGRWSAGLTTKPNANVATDWPEGEGSSEYDYWSPKLVNVGSTSWDPDGTDNTWALNCERVLRRLVQWMSLTANVDAVTLLCVLSGDWLTQFKDMMATRSRILVPHKESEDLGFPDTLNFEGLALRTEFGISASRGYCVNVDTMELCILPDELIKTKGPDYDPDSLSYKFGVYTFGNYKFLPKNCAKLYTYASS